jgi:hypothetical protein
VTGAPAWLEQFEAQFSQMLRTPLDRSSGTLRAQCEAYGPDICAAAREGGRLDPRQRLAIYNRQYWFRLFGAFQHEFPATTALLGAWHFSALAGRFLEESPPQHHDLGRAADGFARSLEQQLSAAGGVAQLYAAAGLARGFRQPLSAAGPAAALERQPLAAGPPQTPRAPARALAQALRIDEAFRQVFRAPQQSRLTLTAAELQSVEHARLRWSTAVCLVEEDWPLLPLRRRRRGAREGALAVPPQYANGTHHWAVCQEPGGQRLIALAPWEATLLRLLQRNSVSDALAELERACPAAEHAALVQQVPRWLAASVQRGFWTGMDS